MLAARLYGPQDLRLEEVPVPEIGSKEVLVQVKAAAVCGTDLRMYQNGAAHASPEHPLTIGHEFAGVIAKVGDLVDSIQPGMKVSIAPNIGCGHCDACVAGNVHMCDGLTALGINIDGAFAEYIRIPEQAVVLGNIAPLGDTISFEEAAINEALSCVYNGFLQCEIGVGDYVLIIGAGPIGVMHAKLAKLAGAAKVMLSDVSEERLKLCRKIDNAFIPVPSADMQEIVKKQTGGKGLDVCITACPVPGVQAAALDMMATGGRVNFFGGLPKSKEIVPINTNIIHYKQLKVTGSTKANTDMVRKTLALIDSGALQVKDLITARFPLRDIQKAMDEVAAARGIKTVITF